MTDSQASGQQIDLSKLSAEQLQQVINQAVADEMARRDAVNAPRKLSPTEQVGASLDAADRAEAADARGPRGHTDSIYFISQAVRQLLAIVEKSGEASSASSGSDAPAENDAASSEAV